MTSFPAAVPSTASNCDIRTVSNTDFDRSVLTDTLGGDVLLSRKQLAAALSVHQKTIPRWEKLGIGLRPIRIGPRRLGYRVSDVRAFIEARSRGPNV